MKLEEYLALYPKKHIIFDLDRTLAHLLIDWMAFGDIFSVVATFDKPLSKETIPFHELANRAIQKHGEMAQKAICEFNETYELSHYGGYTPNDELLTFIRKNQKTYPFYLWTSNARKTIQDFLQKESFITTFKTIVTREDVYFIKPNGEGFKKIYIPGTELSDYLMVGDSVVDEGGAKDAGIDFFKIDYFST